METKRNDLEMPKSRVYVWVDEKNHITRLEGEYSLPNDLSDAILIDEGNGDTYSLAQTHYLDKPLFNEEGNYNYKYINGEIVEV